VDLNGDGSLDVVVANYADGTVSVLLNDLHGGLSASHDYPAGSTAGSIAAAVGDMNGDGSPDIVVANWVEGSVTVLLNNHDGTFQAPVGYPAGGNPDGVALGDLAGKGRLDVVVSNSLSIDFAVFLNDGAGALALKGSNNTGGAPWGPSLGKLHGTGASKLDMVQANYGSSTLGVFLNNGDGTFTGQTTYPVGLNPIATVLRDLDGDGILDVAVANKGDGTIGILLGQGGGSFAAQAACSVGSGPKAIGVADFDGDGRPDLFTVNNDDNSVSVILHTVVP
jgi:hypothetical protein